MDGEVGRDRGSDVGTMLRACRLRVGASLSEASEALCIREAYLAAIEEGRFQDLPGSTYASGFVRAYAEYLGVHGEEMVRRFKDEVAGMGGAAELHFPSPMEESGFPGGALLLIGIVIALLGYGGWYLINTRNDFIAELVAPLPDRLVALLPGQAANNGDNAAPGSASPADGGTPLATPSPPAQEGPGAPETGSADTQPPPAAEAGAEQPAGTAAVTAAVTAPSGEPSPPAATGGESIAAAPAGEAAGSTQRLSGAPTGAEPQSSPSSAVPGAAEAGEQGAREPAGTEGGNGNGGDVAAATAANGAGSLGGAAGDAAAEASAEGLTGARPGVGAPAVGVQLPRLATVPVEAQSAAIELAPRSRIVLKARDASWVEIRDEFGDRVMSRVLTPGETYAVPNEPGLRLTVGNAGGLEVLVDGRPTPSLGEIGMVRRGVLLDPEALAGGRAGRR